MHPSNQPFLGPSDGRHHHRKPDPELAVPGAGSTLQVHRRRDHQPRRGWATGERLLRPDPPAESRSPASSPCSATSRMVDGRPARFRSSSIANNWSRAMRWSDDFKRIAAREIDEFKVDYRNRFPGRDVGSWSSRNTSEMTRGTISPGSSRKSWASRSDGATAASPARGARSRNASGSPNSGIKPPTASIARSSRRPRGLPGSSPSCGPTRRSG